MTPEQIEQISSLAAVPAFVLVCLALVGLAYQLAKLIRNGKDDK